MLCCFRRFAFWGLFYSLSSLPLRGGFHGAFLPRYGRLLRRTGWLPAPRLVRDVLRAAAQVMGREGESNGGGERMGGKIGRKVDLLAGRTYNSNKVFFCTAFFESSTTSLLGFGWGSRAVKHYFYLSLRRTSSGRVFCWRQWKEAYTRLSNWRAFVGCG